MIKKLSLIILPILFSSSFLSCKKENIEEIDSDIVSLKRVEDITSLVEITSASQFNNIARYDEAMIIIYRVGCTHCENLFSSLREIIKKEHILVYFLEIDKYLEAYNDISNKEGKFAFLYPKVTSTPTTLFFSNGELKNYYVGNFKDINLELFEYIEYSNMYLVNDFILDEGKTNYHIDYEEENDYPGINTTNLDSLISKGNKVTIMYSWRKCGDCKEYYKYVLNPYLNKNSSKKIYIYEVDGYYSLKNSLDENNNPNNDYLNLWYDFSNKYHLSDYVFYDKYNHLSGVVPTIVTYYSITNYSINVFRNDYNVVINSDNTLSYLGSFYSEVKEIKTTKKVTSDDKTSSDYISALKELQDLALEKEIELSKKYLENNL